MSVEEGPAEIIQDIPTQGKDEDNAKSDNVEKKEDPAKETKDVDPIENEVKKPSEAASNEDETPVSLPEKRAPEPVDNSVVHNLTPSDADGGVSAEGEEDQTLTFPQKLMEILEKDEEHGEIISWLPHGRGFMIYKKKQFETDVMPKYFQKHSKYTSFTRKLNRWGFVRVTRGAEMGAYYHKMFKRAEGRLCMQMTCHRPSNDGLTGGGPENNLQSQAMFAQMAMQQGYPMGAGQNYLQMQQQQQQQHMQMLMRHREQMMHREAMMRAQGGGGQGGQMMQMGGVKQPQGGQPGIMVPPQGGNMMMHGMMGMSSPNQGHGMHPPQGHQQYHSQM